MQSQLPEFEALDPADLLTVARSLQGNADPASKRSAGDRAYYAAFLISRVELANRGLLIPTGRPDDHRLVMTVLRGSLGNNMGNRMEQLRRARNMVTYDMRQLRVSDRDVRPLAWMIQTAEDLIKRVRALP